MLPATATRVEQHTAEYINERIRRQTEENIARIAAGGRAAIDRRLAELDQEWDMERTLQTNFASVVLAGIALGEFVDRRWHLLPVVAAGFMVQHALQGWCPPVEVFRRLGFRTQAEIDHERYALKALRGDFRAVRDTRNEGDGAGQALQAARR